MSIWKTQTKQDLEDLRDKIDWEGGIYEAFVNYGISTDDPEINQEVKNLARAFTRIENRLYELYAEKGVTPL